MGKSKAKTGPTDAAPADFIAAIEDPARREDAAWTDAMMRRVTGERPRMWGPSIIGYGAYHYVYPSGAEGDSMRIGFSPRKAELVLYILGDGDPETLDEDPLLARLGRYRRGKSCLYVKRLDQVDRDVLEQLARRGWERMAERYPA